MSFKSLALHLQMSIYVKVYASSFHRYLGNWDNDVEAAIAHDKATINIFGKNGSGTINFPLEGISKKPKVMHLSSLL